MRKLLLFSIFILVPLGLHASDCLTLESAWRLVLQYAPSIGATETEVGILQGEAYQVSLLPNPVFEVEVENIGITHPTDETDPPQSTYSLSQLIELGGKRAARRAVACSLAQIAAIDSEINRKELFLALKSAFIEARAAQEKVRICQERLYISEAALSAVKQQVDLGKLSSIEARKVSLTVMSAKMAYKDACSLFECAKKKISSMWGETCSTYNEVLFTLFDYFDLPPLCTFSEGFYHTPEFYKAQYQVSSASKNVCLQKANSIPDINVAVGYRVFHDTNKGALVVGAAIPLPFFDRNQGAVRSAVSSLSQAQFTLAEIIRENQEAISFTYKKLSNNLEELEMIRTSMLPEAIETYSLTEEGYAQEKFAFSTLLEAKEILCDIEEKEVDLLMQYHLNLAELAHLSGVIP